MFVPFPSPALSGQALRKLLGSAEGHWRVSSLFSFCECVCVCVCMSVHVCCACVCTCCVYMCVSWCQLRQLSCCDWNAYVSCEPLGQNHPLTENSTQRTLISWPDMRAVAHCHCPTWQKSITYMSLTQKKIKIQNWKCGFYWMISTIIRLKNHKLNHHTDIKCSL
jgi:hypothetical protein